MLITLFSKVWNNDNNTILCKKWRIKVYFNTNFLFILNRLYWRDILLYKKYDNNNVIVLFLILNGDNLELWQRNNFRSNLKYYTRYIPRAKCSLKVITGKCVLISFYYRVMPGRVHRSLESVLTFSPAISGWRRPSGKSDRVGLDTNAHGRDMRKRNFFLATSDLGQVRSSSNGSELIERTHRHASSIASKL